MTAPNVPNASPRPYPPVAFASVREQARWRSTWAWTLAVSTVSAALIWALSPLLAGHREPWDADGPYYVLALVVAGAAAGVLAPRPWWAHYLGAWLGQLLFQILFLPIGSLVVLGAILLLGYSAIFALGAKLAARAVSR